MADFRPTICIDFDGVIHKYSRGWHDGTIYDDVVPGFFEWASIACLSCNLVVFSSRSKDQAGIDAMMEWLGVQTRRWQAGNPLQADGSDWPQTQITFARTKPAAWVSIDDRAIPFNGSWSDPALAPYALAIFQPWNRRQISVVQRLMARAALGLPNAEDTTNRNRYLVRPDSPVHEGWMVLVARGLAFRIDASLGDHGTFDVFRLTREGALAVLDAHEMLLAADFGEAG